MNTAAHWKGRIVVAGIVLLMAACDSSSSDPASDSTRPPIETSVTSTTVVEEEPPRFSMSLVTFGPESFVAITNTSGTAGTMRRLWLCGEVKCLRLPRIGCDDGDSMVIAIGDELPPLIPAGTVMVEDFRGEFETLDISDGQIGLFTKAQPRRARHVYDYVEWGVAGHEHSELAISAGVWETGHVPVSADTAGVFAGAFPTEAADDWEAQTALDLVEPPQWMTGNPYPIP